MPWTTAQKKIRGRFFTWLDDILCSARSPEAVDDAVAAVQALMRQRHHVALDGEEDFNIRRPDEVIKVQIETSQSLEALLLTLASISLVVGGIGITNVMLASVTARTQEIGVRVAVGATPSEVRVQFLGEAGMLGVLGSLLGTLLAVVATPLIGDLLGWQATPSAAAAAVAVSVAVTVGAVAGLYPAWVASQLDPIAALQSER